jgi:phosphoesterase RecJ-like protein
MTDPRRRILEILSQEDDFLLACHAGPDGDALGSMSALGHILTKLGKRFRMYNESGVPEHLRILRLPGEVLTEPPADTPKWIITMDCGDLERTGDAFTAYAQGKRIVNIDHHLGNPMFGEVNWVDTGYSSVGEMIAGLAEGLDIPLDGDIGEGVYMALVSDTGYFAYGNTKPKTMRIAADIVERGLDPGDFNVRLQNTWSLNRLQLMSAVLDKAALHFGGRLGVVVVTLDMMRTTGTTAADTEGLVNYVRRIRGVEASALLREDEPGIIKISLRSPGIINVQELAARFGGGGHRNASGARMEGSPEAVLKKILDAFAEFFENAETAHVN